MSYSYSSEIDMTFLELYLRKHLFDVELTSEQEIDLAFANLKFLDIKLPEVADDGIAIYQPCGSFNWQGLISKDGWIVRPFTYYQLCGFSEGLCLVLDAKFGFINIEGNIVIPLIYEAIPSQNVKGFLTWHGFYKGYCPVRLNGKSGWIDKQGNWYDKHPEQG